MKPPQPGAKPGMHYAKPGQTPAVRPALQRQPTAEERRRAQRVLLRIPVLVHLKDKPKPIEGMTQTVNATGGTIILAQGLAAGTKFTLENPRTHQKVEVHVQRPSQINPEGSLVAVEFLASAPQFWNIFFPTNTN